MLSYHPVKIAKQRDSSWSITGTGNRHSGIRVISCGRLHCFHAPNIIAINGVVSCVDTDATNAVFSDNDEIFSTLNLLARSSEKLLHIISFPFFRVSSWTTNSLLHFPMLLFIEACSENRIEQNTITASVTRYIFD